MHPEDPQFTNTLPSSLATRGPGSVAAVVDDGPSMPLGTGEFIGRYRIRERVGEGGMGVVYRAEDPELGRMVAIKLLRPVQGDEAEVHQRRMLREAQALARLSHRNLVMVFDVGSRGGRVWIAMEYVVGDTLEVWLGRERRSWGEIVDVFIEAGRGLAAVHAAGLVHRDFKPGNVIVRQDGMVQVLDFGLAARAGERDADEVAQLLQARPDLDAFAANLTKTGGFMGTPAYMAPEQFLLMPMDGRADQFGFCVAFYEAIYGHRPFKGRDLAELMKATSEGLSSLPPELPGLPLAVRQVIAKGLARDPNDRFPDMDALVAALAAIRAPVVKTSSGLGRFALGMMVGGGALAIGVGVWLTWPTDDVDSPFDTPETAVDAPVTAPARPDEPRRPADRDDEPTIVEEPLPTPEAEPSEEPALPQPDARDDEPGLEPTTPSSKALPGLQDLEERDEPGPDEPKPVEPKPTPSAKDPPPDEPAKPEPGKPSDPLSEPKDEPPPDEAKPE